LGKLGSIIKSEIQRLAKREVRDSSFPLRRKVRAMKLKLSSLSKNFAILDRLAKELIRREERKGLKLEITPEEVKALRITPNRIRNLRKKLGVSQRKLAILAGVSNNAVALWEKGNSKPSADNQAVLMAIQKWGKQDVRRILAQKAESKVERKRARSKADKGQMGMTKRKRKMRGTK
jgi:DNA-binding transcriptional regulator YiaG